MFCEQNPEISEILQIEIPNIPSDLTRLTQPERGELVSLVFKSLFVPTPNYTYEQKINLFRFLILSDYQITQYPDIATHSTSLEW